jgi:hypothetical protein
MQKWQKIIESLKQDAVDFWRWSILRSWLKFTFTPPKGHSRKKIAFDVILAGLITAAIFWFMV